jgi:hypothetical protein
MKKRKYAPDSEFMRKARIDNINVAVNMLYKKSRGGQLPHKLMQEVLSE